MLVVEFASRAGSTLPRRSPRAPEEDHQRAEDLSPCESGHRRSDDHHEQRDRQSQHRRGTADVAIRPKATVSGKVAATDDEEEMETNGRDDEPYERRISVEVGVGRRPHDHCSDGRRRDRQGNGSDGDDPALVAERDPANHELLDRQQDDDKGQKVGGQEGGNRGEGFFAKAPSAEELIRVGAETGNQAPEDDVERAVAPHVRVPGAVRMLGRVGRFFVKRGVVHWCVSRSSSGSRRLPPDLRSRRDRCHDYRGPFPTMLA